VHIASQVLWTSILASAAVAGFVTLLIEYLAKPRLEARKERILDDMRQVRIATNGLRRAIMLSGRLRAIDQSFANGPNPTDEILYEYRLDYAAEIEKLLTSAYEQIEAPAQVSPQWTDSNVFVTGVMATIRSAPPGPKFQEWGKIVEVWDEVGLKLSVLESYIDLFSTSRWRVWRRASIMHRILLLSSGPQGSTHHKPKDTPHT